MRRGEVQGCRLLLVSGWRLLGRLTGSSPYESSIFGSVLCSYHPIARLPAPGTVPRPGSTKEAREMLAVGRRMLEVALMYGQEQRVVGDRETEVILEAVCGRSGGLGGQKI